MNVQIWDQLSVSEFERLAFEYAQRVFLVGEKDTCLVAAWQGFPVGFLVARYPILKRIFVLPDVRRKGVGTALVRHLQEEFEWASLETEPFDPEMTPFFDKLGWSHALPERLAFRRELDSIPGFEVPAPYLVRPYREGDHLPWIELVRESFATEGENLAPENDEFLLNYVRWPLFEPGDVLQCWHEGRLVGSLVSQSAVLDDQLTASIEWLAVHPDHRNQGLGRTLLLAALHLLREKRFRVAHLHTHPACQRALRLYAGLGFQPYTERLIFRQAG